MPATETLNWTQNAQGSQAITAEGTFFLAPAREKSATGSTQFQLSFMRTDGARHRETYRVIGTFESPYIARLTAEVFPRD